MLSRNKISLIAFVIVIFALIVVLALIGESKPREVDRLAQRMTNPQLSDSLRISVGQELLISLEKSKDIKSRVETYLQLGDLMKADDAQKQYETGLVLSREFKLRSLQGQLLNKLGIVYRKKRDYQEAIKLHDQALKLADDGDSKANYLNSKGITLMSLRDYQAAKVVFAQAILLNLKNENQTQLASVYNNLGLIAQREANYGEGLFFYDKAMEARIQLSDTVEWARVVKNKAIVFNQLGDFAKAAESLLVAIDLFESVNQKKLLELASAYNSLGVAYVNLKEYEIAGEYYTKAIKLRKEINNLSGLAGSFNNMGNLHRYTGKFDSARWYLLKSIELKKELKRDISLIPSYKNLAEVYIESGQFSLAEIYLDSAKNLGNAANNNRLLASNHLTEALLHLRVLNTKKAKIALGAAMTALKPIGSKDLILEVYDLSRKAYFLEGNAAMAERFVLKYDSLDDHVSEEQRMKVVKLKPQRENAELVWLNQKKEADDAIYAENRKRLFMIIIIISLLIAIAIGGLAFYRRKSKRTEILRSAALNQADLFKKRSENLEEKQAGIEKGVQSGLAFFEDHVVIRTDARDKKKASLLPYKEIVLVKTNGDYLYWYTREEEEIVTRTTMSSITEELNTHGLVRCHRSWIINRESVDSLEKLEDGSANLLLHTELEVLTTSKTHKKKLIKQRIDTVPVGGAFLEVITELFGE